ncbi:hypothetical protein F7P69_01425 [Cellulosimicrobium funkei]|nr:hypothetical protein [Cellulosimicrobium funkei]
MTTTTPATNIAVLNQTTELDLIQQVLPGGTSADLRVDTTLSITGTSDEGRSGWADLTFYDDENEGRSTIGFDGGQARQLAAYLLQVADELDARTRNGQEFQAAA